jgi:hypothetical protein
MGRTFTLARVILAEMPAVERDQPPQQKCCGIQLPLTGPCRPDLVPCSRVAHPATWGLIAASRSG